MNWGGGGCKERKGNKRNKIPPSFSPFLPLALFLSFDAQLLKKIILETDLVLPLLTLPLPQ